MGLRAFTDGKYNSCCFFDLLSVRLSCSLICCSAACCFQCSTHLCWCALLKAALCSGVKGLRFFPFFASAIRFFVSGDTSPCDFLILDRVSGEKGIPSFRFLSTTSKGYCCWSSGGEASHNVWSAVVHILLTLLRSRTPANGASSCIVRFGLVTACARNNLRRSSSFSSAPAAYACSTNAIFTSGIRDKFVICSFSPAIARVFYHNCLITKTK